MSTMVERVALAIAKTKPTTRVGYNEYGQHVEIDYGPVARAAIEAMMDLTEPMRIAALNTLPPGPGDPPLYEKCHRRMIQAALKESDNDR